MQPNKPGGFRRFLRSPLGRALLIALAVGVVYATFVYVSLLLAIPAMLVVGLMVPIYAGLKRPRYLAISGLVIILLVAPIASVAYTEEVMTPTGFAHSNATLPYGNGGSVLQDAHVSPFVGSTSTNFTWTVSVYAQYRPPGPATINSLTLYISTCPGATNNTTPYCPGGYDFFTVNTTAINATGVTNVTFHYTIGTDGIWDWQMGLAVENNTSKETQLILLVGDPTYNAIQGPVVGDFATFFVELLPTLYVYSFLYLGAPFFFVLLLYMVFKSRERRHHDLRQRTAGPIPPTTPPPPGPGSGSGPAPGPPAAAGIATGQPADEKPCPNCAALVYPGEPKCWKCGASLTGGSGQPLPSQS